MCCGEEPDVKASELCNLWEGHLQDSDWFPFVNIKVWKDKYKAIINEKDEKLNNLRKTMGDEVFKAVTTGLTEMNEYSASGRYAVPELWNFKEERRPTLKEGIQKLSKFIVGTFDHTSVRDCAGKSKMNHMEPFVQSFFFQCTKVQGRAGTLRSSRISIVLSQQNYFAPIYY